MTLFGHLSSAKRAFSTDEAVDLYAENPLVRYMRARVDAYLPAAIGRCVVTLNDTEQMLKTPAYSMPV